MDLLRFSTTKWSYQLATRGSFGAGVVLSFLTALTKSLFSAVVRLITFLRISTGGGAA